MVVRLDVGGDRRAAARHGAITIEIRLRQQNPFETTVELPMVLAAGYLLGSSIVAWLRAGSIAHTDLRE